MTRDAFTQFTRETIERAVSIAEEKCARPLSRELRFQWLGKPEVIDSDVAEAIVSRVFVGPDLIYPCVDIGVAGSDVLGRTVLVANVAGYPPKPFGKNWFGTDGPYIIILGAPLLAGATIPQSGLPREPAFGFSIPGFPGKD